MGARAPASGKGSAVGGVSAGGQAGSSRAWLRGGAAGAVLWRSLAVLWAAAGVLAALLAALVFAFDPAVTVVDPRTMAQWPSSTDGRGLAGVVGVAALGMAAAAGLPLPRRGADPTTVGQVAAAVAVLVGTAVGARLQAIWTFGPDDPCLYPSSCWPAEAQSAAASAPGVLSAGGLLLAATGTLVAQVRRS